MNSEIAFNEPALAFDGGILGLKIIQTLIGEAPKFLAPKGWLIFGVGQGEFISQLCEKMLSYQQIKSVEDDLGNIRVILVQSQIIKI